MSNSNKVLKISAAIIAVIGIFGGGLVALIVWEGSSAREEAPAHEAVEAGHQLYTQKCEICHAYDGGGKSEIGSGQYPRPPDLRSAEVQKMSDGEWFYHLRNGIRQRACRHGRYPIESSGSRSFRISRLRIPW